MLFIPALVVMSVFLLNMYREITETTNEHEMIERIFNEQ